MSENERDDLPAELEAAYRAERNRPPMDDEHARRIRLAVAAKLGPLPPSEGGSDPPTGGTGGAPPPAAPAGSAASSLLSASHLAVLVTGLATGVVVGALGHAALVMDPPPEPRPLAVEVAPTEAPTEAAATAVERAVPPDEGAVGSADEAHSEPPPSPAAAEADRPIPTLAAERRLVDLARAALAQGRHEPALSALATHRRRFRDGSLAEERDALEVEALAAAGRREEASRAATEFERAHPESLYRARVRSVLGH